MNQANQEIFNKVSSAKEKEKIFSDLIKSRTELFCKGPGDEVFKLSCERVSPDNRMVCLFVKTENHFDPTVPLSVICQFNLGGEKYFFKSTLDFRIKSYTLDLSSDLFQLQRRQSYRIRIPSSTRSNAEVIHQDTKEMIKAVPADLSTGGCCVIFKQNQTSWKPGDKIQLHLKISHRDPLQLPGVVRHVRPSTPPETGLNIGLQFEGISLAVEKELFSITMELYREFFSRIE